MNQNARANERSVRKRLLRLEAESHRLEMAASWRELRKPTTHLKSMPVWLGVFGLLGMFAGKGGGIGPVATLLGALRLESLAKVLPLIASGWRALGLLRGVFSRIRLPKRMRLR